ncbi:TRAP transporter substrate-binding protein [Salibacterium aidingense]|uniref:TRAP transporter substrate-binding protein n=1 Tax=Salibacterium aidingense TaxID=384933 RepID=UPI000407400A|nr:TRAP transporter substrate-binding protein [Salibacterium aidingense]
MKGKLRENAARFVFLCLMIGVITVVTACGGNQSGSSNENTESGNSDEGKNGETITLSYAFFAPESTFPAVQMKKWSEELEKRTDGQVEVELFFGGSLLEANNMFDGVENETADIGLTATTYEPGRFPLLEISEMPSDYPNSQVSSQVLNDLISEFEPVALDDFKLITSFATEPAYIQSKDRISSLEELSGKQLRISGGSTPVMEKLGAAPVGLSQAEVPEGLQTGVIEGNVSSREVLKDFKLAEMVKYVTDYPLTVTSFVAIMNQDTWNSLPDYVKDVIDDLNHEMSIFTGQYLDEHVKEAMEWSKETEDLEVVSLSEEEKQKWDEALEEMQGLAVEDANAEGLPGDEYQEKLYELIEKYSE